MSYPKYVRAKGSQLYYQRDFPTSIRMLIGKKTYSAPLKLTIQSGITSIQRAALEHTERFDLECKSAKNSDLKAFTEAEIDRLALKQIERIRLEAGSLYQLQKVADPECPEDIAEMALGVDRFDRVVDKFNNGENLTVNDQALIRARQMLTEKKTKRPPTLSQLWIEYVQHRNLDITKRPDDKAQKRWDRWFSLIGEQFATHDLNEAIADALQDYADNREGEVSQSTVERELSDIMSCLKLGSKRHKLRWLIERPYIKQTSKNKRIPLTLEEQRCLIQAIYNPKLTDNKKRYAVLALLYIQGGMMPSEVARLNPSDISLDSAIPHILIRNDTKTDARKRILPIVVGLQFLQDHLVRTIEWLRGCTESTWSMSLKRFLRDSTGNPKVTGHWLRHSFRANAQAVGADVLTIASIAGWTDEQRNVSAHLLDYGSEGISNSDVMSRLYEANKQINNTLISKEREVMNQSIPLSNVVSLR